MKKFYLLLIGAALISVSLQGQFKMTAKSHGFKVGDSHNFIFAKGIDEGQSGQDVIWDFTNLEKINKNLTSHMLDSKGQDNSNSINNSNLVLEEFGNKFFFDASNSGMYQYGSVACNTVTKYDKPFVKLKFPFSYGNKVTGNYSGIQTSANTSHEVSGLYEIFADAYGTLLLPNDVTYENVLRIRQTRTIQFQNSNSQFTEITYRWYDKDVRYPVLVMVKYVTENNSRISEVAVFANAENKKKSAKLASSAEVSHGISGVSIYPNPYDEYLNVAYNLEKDSKVKIDLYDVSGKLYKNVLQSKQDKGPQAFNFSSAELGMKPGVYYIKISAGDQTFTRKVIKQ